MKCNRLLLFDIDCTLLNTGGAGMAAFHSTAEELYSDQISKKGVCLPSGNDLSYKDQVYVIKIIKKIISKL